MYAYIPAWPLFTVFSEHKWTVSSIKRSQHGLVDGHLYSSPVTRTAYTNIDGPRISQHSHPYNIRDTRIFGVRFIAFTVPCRRYLFAVHGAIIR